MRMVIVYKWNSEPDNGKFIHRKDKLLITNKAHGFQLYFKYGRILGYKISISILNTIKKHPEPPFNL